MSRLVVALTGASGQLGRAIVSLCPENWVIEAISRVDTDITDWPRIRERIIKSSPDLVIHTAAATDVDRCEVEPDWAYRHNTQGTRYVARAAALASARLAYISTNFVFDGRNKAPYHEYDEPNPISFYGASKLAGEFEALNALHGVYVVRTAMVFANEGRNFVNSMRTLFQQRASLRVVDDQFGNPTYATDLARAIIEIINRGPFGIYHVVNSGSASWYEWALEIARITQSECKLIPIPASEYQRPANPPANGRLTSLILPDLEVQLPDWRDALERMIRS